MSSHFSDDSPYASGEPVTDGAPGQVSQPAQKAAKVPVDDTAARRKTTRSTGATKRTPKSQRIVVDAAAVLTAFRPPDFTSIHLTEPQLIFGDNHRKVDPKTGLALHKPYDLRDAGRRNSIRLGIVGTGAMIDAVHRWIDLCRGRVAAVRLRKEGGVIVQKPMDPAAYPPFPGLMEAFDVDVVVGENMMSLLTDPEIAAILKLVFFEERVTALVRLIVGRLAVLSEGMVAPDVVIVALPSSVRKSCTVPAHHKTRGKPKPTLADALNASLERERKLGQQSLFDVAAANKIDLAANDAQRTELAAEQGVFHHGLKAQAMRHGIPVQLAWQTTLEGSPQIEDSATRAWNFWTGIYYKSGGIPWRVLGLERGTCYVGIAFYRDRNDGSLRTSMAQAFSDTGEGIVLRSEPFKWEPTRYSKSPHLPKDLANDLMTRVVAAYESVHHQPPTRIVVHKWQRYHEEEREGFLEAINANKGVRSYDLIAFGNRGLRFFRAGAEPPLRGTMVTLAPEACCYTHAVTCHIWRSTQACVFRNRSRSLNISDPDRCAESARRSWPSPRWTGTAPYSRAKIRLRPHSARTLGKSLQR